MRFKTQSALFLDIDGVLNNEETYRRPAIMTEEFVNRIVDESYMGIDPSCIDRVNRIVRETSTDIILSTSWVVVVGFEFTINWLRWYGLKGNILGHTPRKRSLYGRDNEILLCLSENPQLKSKKGRYVVLDDSPDVVTAKLWNPYWKMFASHVVHTKSEIGLTDADTSKAIKILRGDLL